ncbi:MAG: VPLPA-CTERM sorting domain-containing protein [Pseudomonadota bacterium]
MKNSVFALAASASLLFAGSAMGASIFINNGSVASNNDFTAEMAAAFGIAEGDLGFGLVYDIEIGAGGETVEAFLVAAESGFTNTFTLDDGSVESISETNNEVLDFANDDDGSVSGTFGAGLLATTEMFFDSDGAASSDGIFGDLSFGVYFDTTGSSDFVFLAFDDQAENPDDDNHDDMILRFVAEGGVSVVPLPASALLLMGALAGLGALRRARKS